MVFKPLRDDLQWLARASLPGFRGITTPLRDRADLVKPSGRRAATLVIHPVHSAKGCMRSMGRMGAGFHQLSVLARPREGVLLTPETVPIGLCAR